MTAVIGARRPPHYAGSRWPPCVFTPYATCPMVPEGNTLPVRVEAGERVDAAAS